MLRKPAVALLFALAFASATCGAQFQPPTSAGPRDAASFVADVTIPDGTRMRPGQSFTKTWRLANSGTTTWTGYRLSFANGARLGAPDSVPVPTTLPNATVDISVPMQAPGDAGSHRGNWQLRSADGRAIENVFVIIVVASSAYEGRSLAEWEKGLRATDRATRENALKAVSRFGSDAVPSLARVFREDPDEGVRALALASLADADLLNREVIALVRAAVSDPSPMVRDLAAMLAYEVLPRKLAASDAEPGVGAMAADVLGQTDLRGTVANGKYTSPRGLFSVPVPKSSNFAGIPFAIRDSLGNPDDDVVVFEVRDFGEVLVVGGRRISGAPGDIGAVGDELARRWRTFPVPPEVIDEARSTVAGAETLLRSYRAVRGSLLLAATGRRPSAGDSSDASFALIVARKGTTLVYAIAERDFEALRPGADKGSDGSKQAVEALFASVAVNASVAFNP